jgi:flagellar biosynthesis anti-sigma factor FlgM
VIFPVSNSTPPAEAIAVTNNRPQRLTPSEQPASPADGAELSELSDAVATALDSNHQKVEALRQQVSNGTYVIDPQKVAEKMLEAQIPK